MKTRRIILFIELALFIHGIVAAYCFAINDDGKDKIFSVISNICIGISTGGLVAFLIVIPQYYSSNKSIKKDFFFNFSMSYGYITNLIEKIDFAYKNDSDIVYKDFCTHILLQIEKYSNTIIKTDKYVYIREIKQNAIKNFIQSVTEFLIVKGSFDSSLRIRINELDIEQLAQGIPKTNPQVHMVIPELMEIKNKLEMLKNIFDTTADTVFDGIYAKAWIAFQRKIYEK